LPASAAATGTAPQRAANAHQGENIHGKKGEAGLVQHRHDDDVEVQVLHFSSIQPAPNQIIRAWSVLGPTASGAAAAQEDRRLTQESARQRITQINVSARDEGIPFLPEYSPGVPRSAVYWLKPM